MPKVGKPSKRYTLPKHMQITSQMPELEKHTKSTLYQHIYRKPIRHTYLARK
jgi:hypothetical protein